MKKINLALLSGGISSEREVSLNSGDQVFDALDKEKYTIIRYDPKTDLPRLISEAPPDRCGTDHPSRALWGRRDDSGFAGTAPYSVSGIGCHWQFRGHEQTGDKTDV